MRPLPTTAALLAALLGLAGPADAQGVFPYPIRSTVLDNGLTVHSVAFDSPGTLAYYTVVRTGSRNEVEPGLSGFAHFFEHMMFRGTKTYPQERYNDTLKALGADSNAFTNDDYTCYHMTIPSSALATAVAIEADRFQNLEYDEAAFQKEARAVLGEYNKSASSPFLLLEETMRDRAYTKHTYKHTTIGFLADVKAMPSRYAYSKTFFDRWYRPENCAVVVAGDVDHDALVGLAKRAYGGWKRGGATIAIPEEPPRTALREAALKWPLPTLPILYLGYQIPAGDPANPDVAALQGLVRAVFGETSPLYKALVLDERKVVTLEADAELKRDPGLFTVLARLRKVEDMAEVRARIESALVLASKDTIADPRLRSIKDNFRYGFAARLDSPDAIARTLSDAIALSGRPDAWNTLYAACEALTPSDLQRVASRYFSPKNQTVVTLESEAPR